MKPVLLLLSCLLSFTSFFAQTIQQMRQLEKELPAKHDTALVNALNRLSWNYRRTDTQRAIHFGERASRISRELRYWKGLAYASKNLGMAYSVTGNYPKARIHLDKALQQFSELQNRMEAGNVHNLYGLMHWETGSYDSALVSYDLALRQFTQIGDLEGVAIAHSNIGIIYYETGKLDKALAHYMKALAIARKRNDRNTLTSIHTNIGLVYSQLGDYPKALRHQKKAVRIEIDLEDLSGLAKTYTNIGVVYYNMDLPDSSLVYHRKALQLYEQTGETKGISQSLVNMGSIYHDRGEYGKAGDHYLRALPMKRVMSDALGETIVLTHLGHLRMDEDRNEEAIAFLDTAYRQACHVGSLFYQVETSMYLAQLHEKLGQTARTMHYYKLYTAANDRFLRERSSNRLMGLLIGMATQEKQQRIGKLEQKVSTAYSQKTLTAVTGSIVVAITGLLLLFLRRRHRNEKLRLEAELAANKAALMDYTRQMIVRNAELAALQEQRKIAAETIPTSAETATLLSSERVETLNRLATSRIVTDEDWDEFKQLYARVYPRFMLRMKELFPAITPAELRLAALITLQLSSKEIAAMLGISTESVKKARQRLRKKMELTPEQDLDETLTTIG
jgi:tetratricopeptide (TPR) repeat protein